MRIRKTDRDGRYLGYAAELELSERVELGTLGFLELTKVLGAFHDVAEEMRREHEARNIAGSGS